jgi:hypothetical protein
MKWNDTTNESITARYNITGLDLDTEYNIYNNSIFVQTLTTDGSGNLPSFTIDHDATEREIWVEKYQEIQLDNCSILDQANKVYKLNTSISNSPNTTCMNITAENVTLDCQGNTIDGLYTLNTYGVLSTAYNTTVRNCTIDNWGYGIYYNVSHDGIVDNMSVNINRYAIQFLNSNNIQITNVNVTGTSGDSYSGITINGGNNSQIINTTVNVSTQSLFFTNSENNKIIDSTLLSTNSYAFFVWPGIYDSRCDHEVTNVVGKDNKPIVYYN